METEGKSGTRVSFLVNIAYWAVIVAIVYLVFKYLVNLLMPFFLALIFAAVARPVAVFLSREYRYKKNAAGERVAVRRRVRMNRTVAGIISVILLFLIVLGLLVILFVQLADTVADLAAGIPGLYYAKVLPGITEFFAKVEELAGRIDESLLEMVQSAVPNILSSVGSTVTEASAKVVGWIASVASRLPGMLLSTIICLIATVFIAVDFDKIKTFIRRNLPERPLRMVRDVRDSFLGIVWQFIKSYFIIFCITTTEITVGLLLIGVNRPVLVAVLIAIFDAFPIVGSGMILLPWTILTLISGEVWRGLGLGILYAVVVIARQIIEPKIVGKHVGLRPIVTLICMYAGTRLFGGLIGLFGLPITAAILVDLNDSGILHLFKRPDPAEKAGT